MMLHIVLYEPDQGGNVGNIGRTCVAAGARLHLIEPLGFQLTRREIRRAGMDYWDRVDVTRYMDFEDFREKNPDAQIFMATTKGHRCYTEVSYPADTYLLFGSESRGLPEELLAQDEEHCVRIPMRNGERSLNLANSVAILLYEALRQNEFFGLERKGELHRLTFE